MDLAQGTTKSTVGLASNGTPIITRGVPGPTNVGNMNFGHGAGAWPTANAAADLPTPIPGKTLPISAKAGLDKMAAAKALGRFAAKIATPLVYGMAIYDLAKELGYAMDQSPEGDNTFRYGEGFYCEANCTYWQNVYGHNFLFAQDAMNDAMGKKGGYATCTGYALYPYRILNFSAGATTVTYHHSWAYCNGSATDFGDATGTLNQVAVPPYDFRTFYDKTEADFANAIAAQSGWPSDSAIDRALADAVNGGESLQADGSMSITSTETAVTSGDVNVVQRSDGSSTKDNIVCSWVADLFGTVTWQCTTQTTVVTPAKTETSTVVTTNPDGTTSTQTVTKTTPSTTTTGTATATVTPDKCANGANTLDCLTLGNPTTGDTVPHASKPFTVTPVTFAGGSCPQAISFSVVGHSYTFEYQPLCTRLASLASLFLLIASFIAAWIVADGFRVT